MCPKYALACAVSAANAAGAGAQALSSSVAVPVPQIKGCPPAGGHLAGSTLGLLRLGMARAQARLAYARSVLRSSAGSDLFCLTPAGVRAGYPTPRLLAALPRAERRALASRVVWATSANVRYAIAGVRAGATLAAARRAFARGALLAAGPDDWYLAPFAGATAVLEVRSGLVQEVGIADPRLTATAKLEAILAASLA